MTKWAFGFSCLGIGLVVGAALMLALTRFTPPSLAATPTAAPMAHSGPQVRLTFSGHGQAATAPVFLSRGVARLTASHTGSRNFVVQILDPARPEKFVPSLINTAGAGSWSQAYAVEQDGPYVLNVSMADGDWTLTVEEP